MADAGGGSALNIAPLGAVLTGLTGGSTVALTVTATTDNATWTADPLNRADVSGTVLWFR